MRGWLALVLSMLLSVAHADPPKPCVDAKLKEHIRDLALQAADSWLVSHISRLIDNWLKDYSPASLERGRTGMRRAIEAYQHAHADIVQWDAPLCQDKDKSP